MTWQVLAFEAAIPAIPFLVLAAFAFGMSWWYSRQEDRE